VPLVGFIIRSSFITFCELVKMITHVIQNDHEDVHKLDTVNTSVQPVVKIV